MEQRNGYITPYQVIQYSDGGEQKKYASESDKQVEVPINALPGFKHRIDGEKRRTEQNVKQENGHITPKRIKHSDPGEKRHTIQNTE